MIYLTLVMVGFLCVAAGFVGYLKSTEVTQTKVLSETKYIYLNEDGTLWKTQIETNPEKYWVEHKIVSRNEPLGHERRRP